MAIQQDYAAGKYPTYEHLSARIDEAAREREDQLDAQRSTPASPVTPELREAAKAGADAIRDIVGELRRSGGIGCDAAIFDSGAIAMEAHAQLLERFAGETK